MSPVWRHLTGSPRRVALTYLAFGAVWIFASDRWVAAAVGDPGRVAQLQTAKGWVFVAVSAVLVYGLAYYGRRDLARTNDRLDATLRQTTVLHRVLRHDLRNACNVILGNVDLLRERGGDDASPALDRIETQAEGLVELAEKANRLRGIVIDDPVDVTRTDLVEAIETRVAELEGRYPDAAIDLDLPATLPFETDAPVGVAIHELVENALEHSDRAEPSVRVSAGAAGDGVTIAVDDDGPGLPDLERDVLAEPVEVPTLHARGLGLWIARTVVENADGEFSVHDGEPRGTTVRLSLPAGASARP